MDDCPRQNPAYRLSTEGAPLCGGLLLLQLVLEHRVVRRDGPVMLEGESWQPAIEPARERPCALAEQLQDRRQQDAADDERVEEHGAGEPEPEQLDDALAAEDEGREH